MLDRIQITSSSECQVYYSRLTKRDKKAMGIEVHDQPLDSELRSIITNLFKKP